MSGIDSTESVDVHTIELPEPGELFEGKYEIGELVGSGGFAQVYRATVREVGRDVALKILVPQDVAPHLYPSKLDQRFLREAQLISELRSPYTVTMFDFGRSRHGLLYMVFEFIDGTPLDDEIRQRGAIASERTVHILRQVLQSLREAHKVGILHRDVKPANVMIYDYLDDRDQVKVLDFGIAKPVMRDEEDPGLTKDNTLMGTPRYMSPEQICREQLGPPSDIYSLGLVAYEMLTGQQAIAETDDSTIMRRHLGPDPFLVPEDPRIPPSLRHIVNRMTEKVATNRFQTADEVLSALEHWDENAAAAVPDAAPNDPTREMGQGVPPGFGQQSTQPESGQWMTGGGGGARASAPQTGRFGSKAPETDGAFQPFGSGGTGAGHSSDAQHLRDRTVPTTPPAVAAPLETDIVLQRSSQKIRVEFPLDLASKNTMMWGGGAAAGLLVAIYTLNLNYILLAFGFILFAASRVFRSASLTIEKEADYDIETRLVSIDFHQRGETGTIDRMEVVEKDGESELVLETEKGDARLPERVTPPEAEWISSQVNDFLGRS